MKRRILTLVFVVLALFSAVLPLGGTARSLAATTALEVKGTVTAVSADSLSLVTATGQAMTFRLIATTIYEKYGQPAQQADVQVGLYVAVKYRLETDGTLHAKKVKIERHVVAVPTSTSNSAPAARPTVRARPSARPVTFQLEGTDAGVTAGALVVRVRGLSEGRTSIRTLVGRRLTVRVASGAAVLLNNRPARLGALAVGDTLHIAGTLANGTFTAQRIIAQHPSHRR